MERCLEDLIIRMIYLMTCRNGLSIYPLLLFVVVTNKEQSHHRITGCWLQSLWQKTRCLQPSNKRLSGMSNIINLIALFVCEIPSVPLIAKSWQRLVSVGPLFHCEHLCPRWCSSLECNLKPGTHWMSYRWDISSTRWNWIEKVFTWRVHS
jgi:hypothetical protein